MVTNLVPMDCDSACDGVVLLTVVQVQVASVCVVGGDYANEE